MKVLNVFITGASSGIGKELAKLYSEHNATDEKMNLLIVGLDSSIIKVAEKCTLQAPNRSVNSLGTYADLTTKESIDYVVARANNFFSGGKIDVIILNHATFSSSGRLTDKNLAVSRYIQRCNFESYEDITNKLIQYNLLCSKKTRMGVTSSTSSFVADGTVASGQYALSKRSLDEWFLNTSLPVRSKTVAYPGPHNTKLFVNAINPKDPVRRINGSKRPESYIIRSFGGLGFPPVRNPSISLPSGEIIAWNYMRAVNLGLKRAWTVQYFDEIIVRWWLSAVPGALVWYLSVQPFVVGDSNLVKTVFMLLTDPFGLLISFPITGWPLLLLAAPFGFVPSYRKPWQAPFPVLRFLLGTYLWLEFYLLWYRIFGINFSLTETLVSTLT